MLQKVVVQEQVSASQVGLSARTDRGGGLKGGYLLHPVSCSRWSTVVVSTPWTHFKLP